MDEQVVFKNFRGMDIKGLLSYPENKENSPGIIISHGFLSFKENKLLYRIASKLVENGFAALRFDFSGCVGESQGDCNDIMLSHEVEDLVAAINFLDENSKVDKSRIGLVGHSLGALASIVVASNDHRAKSIVTIGSPARIELQKVFTEDLAIMWEHDRKAKFKSMKGDVEIDFSFYKDLKEYDAEEIIKRLKQPIRIIHGDKDDVVNVENAQLLFNATSSKKDLQIIPNGDHLFLDKEMSEKISALTLDWMKESL